MPRQRDENALREAVLSSGFTPAARDIDGLVPLLGDADEGVARSAERAIVRAAAGAAPAVVARLLSRADAVLPAARARLFRVVGRLAPTDAAPARALVAGLTDADARVQRGAANALGRLRESEAKVEIAAALLEAWDRAPALPLARVLAEAMGKLGLTEACERLGSIKTGDAELTRIASNAVAMLRRDESRGETSEIDGERACEFDVDLVMLCRAGLEELVREELVDRCPSARSARAAELLQ